MYKHLAHIGGILVIVSIVGYGAVKFYSYVSDSIHDSIIEGITCNSLLSVYVDPEHPTSTETLYSPICWINLKTGEEECDYTYEKKEYIGKYTICDQIISENKSDYKAPREVEGKNLIIQAGRSL